jgi:hypothetical protein
MYYSEKDKKIAFALRNELDCMNTLALTKHKTGEVSISFLGFKTAFNLDKLVGNSAEVFGVDDAVINFMADISEIIESAI